MCEPHSEITVRPGLLLWWNTDVMKKATVDRVEIIRKPIRKSEVSDIEWMIKTNLNEKCIYVEFCLYSKTV